MVPLYRPNVYDLSMRSGFEDLDINVLRRRRSEKWQMYPSDVLPAFIAEMDYDLAEVVLAAMQSAIDLGDCGYASCSGIGESFAEFAAARHGWTVDPEWVHLVPEVMVGIDVVLRIVSATNDSVVINPPVYPAFYEHIRAAERQVVEVPLSGLDGGWELDFAALEAAFAGGARAYLMCSPHNPTGRVFGVADLQRIASLAEQYQVTVISDEVHAPLTLAGAQHTPFICAGEVAAATGLTITSASKAFNIAGLKCAVAVAGSAKMQRVLSRCRAHVIMGPGHSASPRRLRHGAGATPGSATCWLSWTACARCSASFLPNDYQRPGTYLRRRAIWPGLIARAWVWMASPPQRSCHAGEWRLVAATSSDREATGLRG